MLTLIALLLGQFQPVPPAALTVDQFIAQSNSSKRARIDAEIASLEKLVQPGATRGNLAVAKATVSIILKRIQTLKDIRGNNQFFPLEIDLNSPELGAIGLPTDRYSECEANAVIAEILQVLDQRSMLVKIGELRFYLSGVNTSKQVDDQEYELEGIWAVAGRYSYVNTLNAKATIFALTPWKYNSQYEQRLAAINGNADVPAKARPEEIRELTAEEFCKLAWERRTKDVKFLNEQIAGLPRKNDWEKLSDKAKKNLEKPFQDQISQLLGRKDLDWNVRDPQSVDLGEVFKIQRTNSRVAINDQYSVRQVIDENTVLAAFDQRVRNGVRTTVVTHRLVIGGLKPSEFLEKTGATIKLSGMWYRQEDIKLDGQTHRRIARWPHEDAVKRRWQAFFKEQDKTAPPQATSSTAK